MKLFNVLLLAAGLPAGLAAQNSTYKIAFGSCAHQDKPLPVMEQAASQKPDLFVFLGDNVYADTRNPDTLKARYQQLGTKPEFQKLKATCPVLATWDDHDFGENDAGRHYPLKKQSKDIFLDFWKEPKNSERRKHDGIYHSVMTGPDSSIQIILLDTRTFRDNLLPNDNLSGHKNDYRNHIDCDSTLLGQAQWDWLEQELRKPAKVRIIATSIQFGHEYNGYESWTNFPCQRQKMLNAIRKSHANGVVFISGDVHWGEISKQPIPSMYPLYDVTSSGMSETWPKIESNRNRVGDPVKDPNFGLITVETKNDATTVKMEIKDVNGKTKTMLAVPLSELQLK